MSKTLSLIVAIGIMFWGGSFVSAGEHGGTAVGKEHGGKEHGGTAKKEDEGKSAPSATAIRSAMKDHVMAKSKASGVFDILDPQTGETRALELIRVHERVGKTGNYYYSCADFKDTKTGQMLDLDLDVEDKGGELSIVDVRIHKLDGKERYTYDENDNRVPVKAEVTQTEGSPVEHGGAAHKEHGGN